MSQNAKVEVIDASTINTPGQEIGNMVNINGEEYVKSSTIIEGMKNFIQKLLK